MTHYIPDLHQRETALNIHQSFLVQAPAGSGKTQLLIQRYLKLLSVVNSPEEIVAITFTNKAADEMRERILHALPPSYAHLRKNPHRLRILTIDAFCLRLAEQLPITSKLGANTRIADNPRELYQKAAKNTLLSQPTYAPSIKQLLKHLDNHYIRLENMLVDLLAKREQWLSIILAHRHEKAKAQLEWHLQQVRTQYIAQLEAAFPFTLKAEILCLAEYARGHLSIQQEKWLSIYELVLTKSGELRKQANKLNGFPAPSDAKNKEEKALYQSFKERFKQVIDALSNEPEFISLLQAVVHLPSPTYTDTQWQVLDALLTLLPIAAAELRLLFSQQQLIDYSENASAALLALGEADEASDVLLALDYQIRHLLVDEFQDTSVHQFKLLEKLTQGWSPEEGKTLFIVGDPMQSIYRFREAEVGLFLYAKHHGIGTQKLHFLVLQANFRSSKNLVDAFNQYFTAIFPKQENSSVGAIPYSPSHAIHETIAESSIVQRYFSDDLQEAPYIAEKILQIMTHHPNESIAILVRSRTHLRTLLPTLQQKNISYQAIDIEPLIDRPIIQDLFTLTKALLHLADDLAWFSILRAPWCGLTLADLHTLSRYTQETTVYAVLNTPNVIEKLSPNGQARINAIRLAINNAIQQRDRYDLHDWVKMTWTGLGGPLCLSNERDLRDAEQFFQQLDTHTNLLSLEKVIEKLYASPEPITNPTLQIMTIHKAKGLEFDHVFLPYLHKKSKASDKPILSWMEFIDDDQINRILLSPIAQTNQSDSIYDFIQRKQEEKLALELDRLLYVAVTRAKKHLYLSGCASTDRPSSKSLLYRFWKFDSQAIDQHTHASTEIEELKKIQKSLKRLRTPFVLGKMDPYSITGDNLPELSMNEHYQEMQLGTVLHNLLQHYSRWKTKSAEEKGKIIQALLSQYHIDPAYQPIARQKIKQALDNISHDEKGQWILRHAQQSNNELAITHRSRQYIIDRTFVDDHGQRWIIDYKITESADPAPYRQQIMTYRKHLATMTGDTDIRLALYFPLLPQFIEM